MRLIRNHVFVGLAVLAVLAICNVAAACSVKVEILKDYVLKGSEDNAVRMRITVEGLESGKVKFTMTPPAGDGRVAIWNAGKTAPITWIAVPADPVILWVQGTETSSAVADVTVKGTLEDASEQVRDTDTDTVTVIDVELTKCSSTWLPKKQNDSGYKTNLTATVTPTLSGVSKEFKFTLYDVSNETGYCVNGGTETTKDLRFESQTGFTISGSDNEIATKTTTDSSAIVAVSSFDYGAYGKTKCEVTIAGDVFTAHVPSDTQQYAKVPKDDNNNHIGDAVSSLTGWSGESSLTETGDGDASLNNNHDGDGLTNYQEYRGIDINNNGTIADSERLNPTRKDLFVRGSGYSGGDAFAYGNAFGEAEIDVHEVGSSFSDTECDVMVVTHNSGAYGGQDGHMNKTGVRTWNIDTLGRCPLGDSTTYGTPNTYKLSIDYYFSDSPYDDTNSNGELDYITVAGVEDTNDNGVLDTNEDDGPGGSFPADDGDGQIDGDHVVPSGGSYDWNQELADDDIDDDGKVELPRCNNTPVNESDEYTKAQVLTLIITHEMGHGAGKIGHCGDSTCLMYQSTINWKRDGHFCNTCRGVLRIHNN